MVLQMKYNISKARTSTLYKILFAAIKRKGYPMPEKDLAMAIRKLLNEYGEMNHNPFKAKPAGMCDGYYMLTSFSWSHAPQGYQFWELLYRGTLHESI